MSGKLIKTMKQMQQKVENYHPIRGLVLFSFLTSGLLSPGTGALGAESDHEPLEKSSTLTFQQIFNNALNNAPEILERDVRRQQAASYEAIADNWIADRPVLNLTYYNDSFFDNRGMREIEYAVQLQLRRPADRASGRQLSESYSIQVDAWENSLQHYIAGRVRSVLSSIAEAEALLALEQEATLNAQDLVDITSTLVDSGELARLDLMQAQNLLLDQRRIELETEALLVDSEREYEVLTGLMVRPDYVYTESLTEQEEITDSHPQLLYLQSDINIAEASLAMTQANARGYPTISLGSRRQRGDSFQPYDDSIALSLSIPFGASSIVNNKTSSARRELVDTEVLYRNTRRTLDQDLHEVEHELFLTEEAIVLAEEQLELSEQRWQMSRTAFTQGEITLTRVIEALQENQAARKQSELLSLKRERLIIEYNQTIGVMP